MLIHLNETLKFWSKTDRVSPKNWLKPRLKALQHVLIMKNHTSIAQRPHARVHNSTGHAPGVYNCKNLNKQGKWNIQYNSMIN